MRTLLAFCLCTGVLAAHAETINVSVDLSSESRPVSPTLWGLFYEDINHAADGGLYAELLRNRNFEDGALAPGCTVEGDMLVSPTGWRMPLNDCADPLTGWSLVQAPGSRSALEIATEDPPFPTAPRYARWTIEEAGEGVALANEGFWGVPMEEGATYRLSLWVNADDYAGALHAAVVSTDGGGTLAEAALPLAGTGWHNVQTTLRATGSDPHAKLVIRAVTAGALRIDSVSLMPEDTWKGRMPGARPDIARMLADLKPAFMRFPGGCIVEGFTRETAWHWEETLGPWQARPGRHNLWGYRSSEGLGLHELFQFAEDIGASPMLILNCGMSCQGRRPTYVPMDKLGGWVDSALNALEYATGSADTTWGKRRMDNGHPAAFAVPFFGIGNENGGPEYFARYTPFYEAIKGRYPETQLIACQPVPDAPMDIVDEHFYATPAWFMRNSRRYDARPRDGAKVLVGEYAANQQAGHGNLEAAIGEAAFMIGLERNADLVVMAAYAPLLQRAEDRTWPVNLIVFDNETAYGTPSYYAQKLFSHHRPTQSYAVDVQSTTEPHFAAGAQVGLGVWQTSAEYRNVRVDTAAGTTALADNAFKPVHGGPWAQRRGMLRQASDRDWHLGLFDAAVDGDFTLSLEARKRSGDEGFLIAFRAKGENDFIWLNLGGWGNRWHGLERNVDGGKEMIGDRVDGLIETARWYAITIHVAGPRIVCQLDGETVLDAVEPPLEHRDFEAGFGVDETTGDYIAKLVNFSEEPRHVAIDLRNLDAQAFDIRYEVLTSDSRLDENTLDTPRKVEPRGGRTAEPIPGPCIPWPCPPWSLTVLRLRPVPK